MHDGWSRWILRAGPQGHAAREDPPAALEGRLHDARDALDQGAPRRLHEPATSRRRFQARPYWDGAAVVSAFRPLPRRGGGEHVLLARRQRGAVAARVLRPRVVAGGRRHARRARRPDPVGRGAPRQHGRGRRRAVPALLGGGAGPRHRRGRRGRAPARHLRGQRRQAPVRRRRRAGLRAPAAAAPTWSSAATTSSTCSRRMWTRTSATATSSSWPRSRSPRARAASTRLDEIHPTALARMLSKAVTRTPHGIGLGIPADHAARHRRGRGAAHPRCRGRRLGGRQPARQARPLLQGRRPHGGGHRRPHARTRCRRTTRTPSSAPRTRTGRRAPGGASSARAGSGRVGCGVIDANDLTATVLGALVRRRPRARRRRSCATTRWARVTSRRRWRAAPRGRPRGALASPAPT